MALAISFDYNGTPVTINTPLPNLKWERVPVYVGVGTDTLFNYALLVSFNDGTYDLGLELRIFTDTPATRIYEVSNQAGMTDAVDITLSNSMLMRTTFANEIYNSDPSATIEITAINSVPPPDTATGTFSGDFVLYRRTPIINNSSPVLTDPGIAATITITNGMFTDIPII